MKNFFLFSSKHDLDIVLELPFSFKINFNFKFGTNFCYFLLTIFKRD